MYCRTDYFKREEKSEETKTEKKLSWKKISSENLDCDLVTLFSKSESDELFHDLEKTIEYNTGDLAQVKVYSFVFTFHIVTHYNEHSIIKTVI